MRKFLKKWSHTIMWSVVFVGVIVTAFIHNHNWIAVVHGSTIALAFANILASMPKLENQNEDKSSGD